jgi:hypothetical protein
MRLILPTLAAILTLSGAAHAQSLGTPSAMNATSPLGVPGATSTTVSTPTASGIPLGATEINPGGLSPMPFAACPTPSSGTFDGGGLTSCTATVVQPSMSGGAPLPAAGSAPTLSGANIPLSATETTNLGLSPPVTVLGTVPTVPSTTIGLAPMNTMTSPMMTSPTMAMPTLTSPTMTTPTTALPSIQGQ